ncbi:MAG: hypothetical protein ABI666_04240 [Ferruginibacter sp.]
MKTKQQVVDGVKIWTKWWLNQRRQKLEDQLSESMSVNPFLLPFLFDYHDLDNFEDLADLIIASHLMIGHSTGFGKLIDEKILPHVFDTVKLDSTYRRITIPYSGPAFNEIDHLVTRQDGRKELLSLKAGKWTIQLTMAMQLNTSFNEIITNHPGLCNKIVVGVFYGKADDLTDKYEILRGINRGAHHNVIDIQQHVEVYSGRDFWKWLNDGDHDTQEWILQGIIEALEESKINETSKELLAKFKAGVVAKYEADIREADGSLNWYKLLKKING